MRRVEAILKVRFAYSYNPIYEDAFDAALRCYKSGDGTELDVDVEELGEDQEEGEDDMGKAHGESESA